MLLPKPVILVIHSASKAIRYTSVLERTGARVQAVHSFEEANKVLSFLHPDLILISEYMGDDDGRVYCQQIRATLMQPRPVLVLMQQSTDVSERIRSFHYGADDVLSEPIDPSELAFRVLAHLRRRQEELSNPLTQLPGQPLVKRMLEQYLHHHDRPWAALSIDINNLRLYNEAYGDLAGDQLIKALGAILHESVNDQEFVGHLEADDFILLTQPELGEEKAEAICSKFDVISKRFYPAGIVEKGYLVATGAGGIRRRVPLSSIAIGIINSTTRKHQSYVDILTTAKDYRYLAKQSPGSHWISDQVPLHCPIGEASRSRILVVEPDGAMACLLEENLALEGYSVQVADSIDDALYIVNSDPHPDLILLESAYEQNTYDGWELCRHVKENSELHNIWVVMATCHPDQSMALDAGADLYLPKPFDIPSLLNEVNHLLRSRLRSGYSGNI
jgi:diguanylate cyclase (GGDEF)-like protein